MFESDLFWSIFVSFLDSENKDLFQQWLNLVTEKDNLLRQETELNLKYVYRWCLSKIFSILVVVEHFIAFFLNCSK